MTATESFHLSHAELDAFAARLDRQSQLAIEASDYATHAALTAVLRALHEDRMAAYERRATLRQDKRRAQLKQEAGR